MKPNTIIKYMRLHIKEAKAYKDVFSEKKCERDKELKDIASYRVIKNLNGLTFAYNGFNTDYRPYFMTVVYNGEIPVLQFNTFYQHTYNGSTKELEEIDIKDPGVIRSNFIRISPNKLSDTWLDSERLGKRTGVFITKDEYFNYSLQYDIPSYELYKLSTTLYRPISRTVEIIISEKLLEIK